jgi:hypothetical protein
LAYKPSMMTDYQRLLDENKQSLSKSLAYLKYSYEKVQKLSMDLHDSDPEVLETWESFVARFARVTDIFVMKYLRLKILSENPAFRGTVKDLLNESEKEGLIENAGQWLDIRDLRNKATHEYTEKELEPYLKKIKELTPLVLAIETKL